MANVRAGVAYVDVRLGDISNFQNVLKAEIESTIANIGKSVGDSLAGQMAPGATKAGKATSSQLSKAFFADANQSFMSGFRALYTGQVKIFSKFMREAGTAAVRDLRKAFDAGLTRLKSSTTSFFKNLGTTTRSALSSLGTGIVNAFRAAPGVIAAAGKAIDSFSQRMGFLSFQMMNFGFIASTAFTAPVTAALTFGTVIGVKTAAQIEQATAALKALTPAGTDVEALVKRLQALAQASPIFNTTDVVTFTQRMVASGLSVKQTEAFLKSFGNIALTVGADISKIPFALEALVQMAGKGTVSMEELRLQLGDALPGAMTIVAQALGVTQKELYKLVEAGDLTGRQLIEALTKIGQTPKFLKGATEGVDTLGSRWQALSESVQNQLGQVFLENSDAIKRGLDELIPTMSNLIKEAGPAFIVLIKGFADLVTWVGKAVDWYKALDPESQKMVNTIALIATVLGPAVILFGAFAGAIAGIASFAAAVLTPVGLVVAALVGAAIEIPIIINYLKNLYAEGGRFKEIWDSVWSTVVNAMKPIVSTFPGIWQSIVGAFNQIKKAVMDNLDSFKPLLDILKSLGIVVVAVVGIVYGAFRGLFAALGPIFTAIGSLISGVIKVIAGLVDVIIGLATGDWKRALDGLRLIWDGLWDAIIGTLANVGKAIVEFVKGFVQGVVDFFEWLYDILVGHSIVPDMVNAILAWFKTLVSKGINFVMDLGRFFLNFYGSYIKPFVDQVIKGGQNILNWFKDLPGKITGALSGAGSWLWNTGVEIVNGLVNGVKSMAGTLKNAILNLIPGPVRGIVESALGINSPSKVFRDIGKNVVLGFIQGIDGMLPRLTTEMNSMAQIVPERATPNFGNTRTPIVQPGGRLGPALNIENYYTNENTDPRRQAEDWYFIISSRGGEV